MVIFSIEYAVSKFYMKVQQYGRQLSGQNLFVFHYRTKERYKLQPN